MGFDETHAAHVSGEVVDVVGAFERRHAVVAQGQVQLEVLDIGVDLVPLALWLDVNRAHPGVALVEEALDEVPTDEAAAAGNDNEIVLVGHDYPFLVALTATAESTVSMNWSAIESISKAFAA